MLSIYVGENVAINLDNGQYKDVYKDKNPMKKSTDMVTI